MENAFPKDLYKEGGGGMPRAQTHCLARRLHQSSWETPKPPQGVTKLNADIFLINLPPNPTSGSPLAPALF